VSHFASDAAQKRLKKRRAAETRLRIYGMAALALAALALGALLWSVIAKAGGALSESYVTLPVRLEAATLDPAGDRDPAKILRANFAGLTKKTLRTAFPLVRKRKDKKALYGLLSSGASFELAQKVASDPGLLGQRLRFDFLASDTLDLYLKGVYGRLTPIAASGRLTIKKTGKTYRLGANTPVFTPLMRPAQRSMEARARRLAAQALREDAGQAEFLRRAALLSGAAKTEALSQATIRQKKRDALNARAAALRAGAADKTRAVKLGRKTASALVFLNGGWIKLTEVAPTHAIGIALVAPKSAVAGGVSDWKLFSLPRPQSARRFSDKQVVWAETLRARKQIKTVFNWRFFTASDSREPELAGIRGALTGTLLTMLVTFTLAFPVGVMAALYLEEFAPKNRLTRFVEVNINNLAAVPSIIFGLLGLAVFIGVFGVPRSAPLAGGIVLALMTMPCWLAIPRRPVMAISRHSSTTVSQAGTEPSGMSMIRTVATISLSAIGSR